MPFLPSSLPLSQELCLGRYGSDCQLVHRATTSDTCYSIAAQYGIEVSMMETNNPSMDCDQIYDGLNLCVASGVVRPNPSAELATYIADQKASSRRRRRRDLGLDEEL